METGYNALERTVRALRDVWANGRRVTILADVRDINGLTPSEVEVVVIPSSVWDRVRDVLNEIGA